MGIKGGVLQARTRIQWTENARVQLIQAVIRVEAAAMKRAEEWPRFPGRRRQGWKRINDLLPPELQGPSPGLKYSDPKCKRVFDELVKSYKDGLQKNHQGPPRYKLTNRVHAMMTKREDLWNASVSHDAESTSNFKRSFPDEVTPGSSFSEKPCSETPDQRKLPCSRLGPPSQSATNFKDPGDRAESTVLPEDQSQAHQNRTKEGDFDSSTWPPGYYPRDSTSVRKSTPRRLPRRRRTN